MKKLLLSLVLSLGALSVTPAMAAAPAFSASQMVQVKIKDLSFKEVMREFYSGQMIPTFADDSYIDSFPNIGLGHADSIGYRTVALMHPAELYDNAKGEPRYLVTIEKVLVNDESSEYCFPCGSTADLFSFKKLSNGQFQLVSRTSESVVFYEHWGLMNLRNNDIKDTLLGLNAGQKVYLGSLVWNIRKKDINRITKIKVSENDNLPPEYELKIEVDNIYLTDSAHRHFGIIEAYKE